MLPAAMGRSIRFLYLRAGLENITAPTIGVSPQGGSGIRMLDRTPVGWLPPEGRKKKMDIIKNFAHLSTNNNASSIIYYMVL